MLEQTPERILRLYNLLDDRSGSWDGQAFRVNSDPRAVRMTTEQLCGSLGRSLENAWKSDETLYGEVAELYFSLSRLFGELPHNRPNFGTIWETVDAGYASALLHAFRNTHSRPEETYDPFCHTEQHGPIDTTFALHALQTRYVTQQLLGQGIGGNAEMLDSLHNLTAHQGPGYEEFLEHCRVRLPSGTPLEAMAVPPDAYSLTVP